MGLRDISVALGGMMLLLLVACGTATKSFDHPTFDYTVTMPEDWQVVEEVADITIEISALTPMSLINTSEVVVGKHGLMIQKGLHAGLLLPQVPVNFKWNQKKFLSQVCIKAGLPPDTWRQESGVTLFGFESDKLGED